MSDSIHKTEVKQTKDGSDTLYSNQFGQHFHNINGAISESKHVFLECNGLKEALKSRKTINILEIGFGTGLNLLLLMDQHLNTNSSARINYQAVEAFPLSSKVVDSLNYDQFLCYPELTEKLTPLFDSLRKGMNKFELLPNFSITIFYGPFIDFKPPEFEFHYIFHDAFSPDVNPELWMSSTFQKLLHTSHPNAKLTTYCAASKARAAMAHAGWKIARAPGALGKREMTIASPSGDSLKPFKRVNEKRLAERYEQGDFNG